MFFEKKPWTAEQLAVDLRAAGITTGTNVILHSSLKSVGPVEHGPATILEALLQAIGPTGNLLVPTFTYSRPDWKSDPFDHARSPARTGTIPEFIRKDPRAIRSFHPTHSVAVIGPDAETITENHMNYTALGAGSPFDRMRQRNATILMLGTFQDTNSSLHLCEVLAGLPYVKIPFTENAEFEMAWYHGSRGEIEFLPVREVPGCSRGFRAIEPELISRGILRPARVGNASCQVLSLPQLVDATKEILRLAPTLLLCHNEHCAICPRRRRMMESLSNSD